MECMDVISIEHTFGVILFKQTAQSSNNTEKVQQFKYPYYLEWHWHIFLMLNYMLSLLHVLFLII